MEFSRRTVMGATAGAGIVAVQGRFLAFAQDATPAAIAIEPAATPIGGSLTVYSGRSEGLVAPLIAAIETALGVDIETRYASTSELAATILEEGDASPADVFFSQDAGALGSLAKSGMLAPLSADTLSVIDPSYRSEDGLWIGVSGRARVLAYNSDNVDPATLPASVDALTDASWSGKIGWAPTNASFQTFVTAYRLTKGEEAAKTWLQAMIDNDTVVFEGNSDIVRAVAANELAAGLVNHYYRYEISAEEGEEIPVQNHFFSGGDVGSLVNVAGVGILATAANAPQAQAFVNALLSAGAQTYFAQETFEYPLTANVEPAVDLVPLDEIESPEINLNDLDDLEGTIALLTEVGLI